MRHQLNCNQVVTLLTFYIENKLDEKLSICVREHLSTCEKCREKYLKLKGKSERFIRLIIAILEKEKVNYYMKVLQNFYDKF